MNTHASNPRAIPTCCDTWQASGSRRKPLVATLFLVLGTALLLGGCERPADGGGVDKRMAKMEKQVETLQEQNRDVRAKLAAAHGFGRSPLADFFASPEFWQCTYDSSWADCSSRCSKQTSDGFEFCKAEPEGPERENCIKENSDSGAACLKACPVQTSPLDPPSCRGGAGPA